MPDDTLVILGNSDPEMTAIERLAVAAGFRVGYASVDCERVHAGNAYKFTSPAFVEPATHVVLVECGPAFDPAQWNWCPEEDDGRGGRNTSLIAVKPKVTRIDHHRPGDPGYGKPPEEFLAASSIGQVIAELARLGRLPDWPNRGKGFPDEIGSIALSHDGWVVSCLYEDGDTPRYGLQRYSAYIPLELVLTAAADHCLEAAYRGRCPGVDPEALMRWRVESRSAFRQKNCQQCGGTGWRRGDHEHDEEARCLVCSIDAVLADVEAARKRLRASVASRTDDAEWNGFPPDGIADLRDAGHIPELPDASAREGIPFLAIVLERDGRKKVVLQSAGPELIRRFMAGELVAGLTDYYGDPARGFAGGYLEVRKP